jgi:hypothetical protein
MLTASDQLDVLDAVTRADAAASRRDVEAYVSLFLFTDTAVLDGAMGEHRGKQVLRDSVGPIWAAEGPASVHVTLNPVVDAVRDQPDRAVVTSLLMILTVETPVIVHSVSAITQHLVKVGSNWLIERRSVQQVPST